MKCPECGHHPAAEAEEHRSGGGWIVDHEWVDGVQIEEYRCPICRELVDREETGSRDDPLLPDGGIDVEAVDELEERTGYDDVLLDDLFEALRLGRERGLAHAELAGAVDALGAAYAEDIGISESLQVRERFGVDPRDYGVQSVDELATELQEARAEVTRLRARLDAVEDQRDQTIERLQAYVDD